MCVNGSFDSQFVHVIKSTIKNTRNAFLKRARFAVVVEREYRSWQECAGRNRQDTYVYIVRSKCGKTSEMLS